MTAQQHNQQLNFLQEKIGEIKSAIFFNDSESVLKLPTSIVTTLKVDDFGFVWLTMRRPKQNIKEFDTEFPVRLDYFRKGVDSYVQVCGQGWIVSDPEELNMLQMKPDEAQKYLRSEVVLVKVKITKAEAFESRSTRHINWWQNLAQTCTAWFRHSNYPSNTYYPAS